MIKSPLLFNKYIKNLVHLSSLPMNIRKYNNLSSITFKYDFSKSYIVFNILKISLDIMVLHLSIVNSSFSS